MVFILLKSTAILKLLYTFSFLIFNSSFHNLNVINKTEENLCYLRMSFLQVSILLGSSENEPYGFNASLLNKVSKTKKIIK